MRVHAVVLVVAACAALLSHAAASATRSYETATFDKVSVASGIEVDIVPGSARSVVASTRAEHFKDLRIEVKGNELRIDRPPRNWFRFWRRPDYSVRVVMPALRSVVASSGSHVMVKGAFTGDLDVRASSGSQVDVEQLRGGRVRTRASSGSELRVAGSCHSLDVETSSGSDLDAGRLLCESVTVVASSGSEASVAASQGLTAKASSGADVRVNGAPALVKVSESSGGSVDVQQASVDMHQVEK